jgi:hypothetical protein
MPRGECKIWSLTYSTIAEWTGLRVVTVRNCASRGDFDPRDIESVLCWVNARRQRLGMPISVCRTVTTRSTPQPLARPHHWKRAHC